MSRIIEKNKVVVAGEIAGKFEYSHKVYGEEFYTNHLKIERTSGLFDLVPIVVSERMIDVELDWTGHLFEIEGQFRSYNKHEENANKLILAVFAREMKRLHDLEYVYNCIDLDGYICKETQYRKTPLGREICDILLAVNRPYGKSDYIPCIAWGRAARFAGGLEIGTRIKIFGRIQSREYKKHISETETETRTAYEVSIAKLEAIEDEE